MIETTRPGRKTVSALATTALLALLGASDAFAGDKLPATTPEPLGEAMHRIFKAQIDQAGQDHYVIYELEWLDKEAKLGPAGRRHMQRIAMHVGDTKYQVIIEP